MRRPLLLTLALLVGAAAGLVQAPLQPRWWWVSALAILLFSAPVVVGAVRWLGVRRGVALLLGLGLYAVVFESVAVATGVPYGRFSYSGVLGPPVFGLAPPTVLLAWTLRVSSKSASEVVPTTCPSCSTANGRPVPHG